MSPLKVWVNVGHFIRVVASLDLETRNRHTGDKCCSLSYWCVKRTTIKSFITLTPGWRTRATSRKGPRRSGWRCREESFELHRAMENGTLDF